MSGAYASDIMAAVHETAEGLHDAGLLSDEEMCHFDESCLAPVHPYDAADVKALRERENVSRTALARYLNVAPDLIGEWESGAKRPSGPASKLLSLIDSKGLSAIV